MAAADVRFHPAAAQEAEEAHEWSMEVAPGGTSFRDFPSAWCTSSAVTTLKSSRSLTEGDGRDTGARDSDVASNFRIRRFALRAVGDPARSAH